MPDEIPDVPGIPPQLLEAARQGRLVIFVGAGVSRLAGGASWPAFADSLLDDLAAREILSFGDLDQLRPLDARKKISIAMDIYDGKGISPDFRTLLHAHVEPASPPRIYRDLYSIGASFVTTNYDEWLDALADAPAPPAAASLEPSDPAHPPSPLPSRVFFGLEQLTIEKLARPGNVVHLHGSVRAPGTMILSARQYIDHYRQPVVTEFLDELFGRYTVLFVGYGLEEDELLEYVLRKQPPTRERRHCRLFARFPHQQRLSEYLASYSLNHSGTQLVEFSIDRRGYGQLEMVVSDWAHQLRPEVQGQLYLEKIKILDKALDQ